MRGSPGGVWGYTRDFRHIKHILIETSHNETAQKRHAVDVEGCIMTTYCWVRQKSGEFQLLVVLSI